MNFPILSSLILLPTIGSLFIFFTRSSEKNNNTVKYVALFTSFVNFFYPYIYGPYLIKQLLNFSLLKIESGLKILLIIKLVLMEFQFYLFY